jgi:transposase
LYLKNLVTEIPLNNYSPEVGSYYIKVQINGVRDKKKEPQWCSKNIQKSEPSIFLAKNYATFITTIHKPATITKLAPWYNDGQHLRIKSFNTIMNTIKINYDSILNYFDKRRSNASAESFNAKIKAFRNQFRGVRKVDFFLFRLTKLFA